MVTVTVVRGGTSLDVQTTVHGPADRLPMTFAAPLVLAALIAIPALGAWYLAQQRRRARAAAAFAAPILTPSVAPDRPGFRRHLPMIVLAVALAALIVAAARPQRTVAVPVKSAAFMLANDISDSMTATDVPPTRLAAAKRAALRFVSELPDEALVGQMSFARRPIVLQSPTADHALTSSAIRQLAPGGGGTAIGETITTAVRILSGLRTAAEQAAPERDRAAVRRRLERRARPGARRPAGPGRPHPDLDGRAGHQPRDDLLPAPRPHGHQRGTGQPGRAAGDRGRIGRARLHRRGRGQRRRRLPPARHPARPPAGQARPQHHLRRRRAGPRGRRRRPLPGLLWPSDLTDSMENDMTDTEDTVRRQGEARDALQRVLHEIKRVIVGQDAMLERVLVSLLAGGHVLLEGVPGLAKTLTVKTLARALAGSYGRIQFTPDLVPADLVGTRVWRPDSGRFDTELGPVFHNFLLADEINRAPAKVQSALLEVMQEHQVTIGGATYPRARAVHRARHPEPDRVRGHLSAARGPGRPLPDEDPRRLPVGGRGGRRRRAQPRAPAEVTECLSLEDLRRHAQTAREVYVDRDTIAYAVALADATRHPPSTA